MAVFTQIIVPTYWPLAHQKRVTTIRQRGPSVPACLVCGSSKPCAWALKTDRPIPSLPSTCAPMQASPSYCPCRKLLVKWSRPHLLNKSKFMWTITPTKTSSNSNQIPESILRHISVWLTSSFWQKWRKHKNRSSSPCVCPGMSSNTCYSSLLSPIS